MGQPADLLHLICMMLIQVNLMPGRFLLSEYKAYGIWRINRAMIGGRASRRPSHGRAM